MKTRVVEIYNENIRRFDKECRALKKKDNLISFLRVLVFVAFVAVFIYYFKTAPRYSFYSFFAFAVVFAFLVKISSKLEEKIKHFTQLIKINKRELEAVEENFGAFNGGSEFIDHQHPYASDLDLFGEGSLFQIINRTCTVSGKIKLAGWLQNPRTKKNEIESIQQSVKELSEKLTWRQYLEATGRGVTESVKEREELLNWLKGDIYFYDKKYLKWAGLVLPVLTGTAFLLALFGVIGFTSFSALFFTQLVLVALHLKKLNAKHLQVGRKFEIVKKYSKLLEYIENEKFESPHLQAQKQALIIKDRLPSQHVEVLSKIIFNLDQRFNVLAAVFSNGFFLWDINYILKLEKWQRTFKDEFPRWIEIISEFDALASIAGFAYNNSDFCYPTVDDSSFIIDARELGHPLLKTHERVTNDFTLSGFSQIVILTGANMAGKSTFLRSVGVNLVLAMTGAPVNASQFTFYPIKFYTSLRTNDSLQKHESFFYAELKKLKVIIEKYENGEELFILLDEILKGTNSKDQHLGSESLIKKLLRLNGVGIIATHDIELANLENLYPKQVKNHCFEIKTELDKLIFDYKIKPGYCKVMNASILMKQIGIID